MRSALRDKPIISSGYTLSTVPDRLLWPIPGNASVPMIDGGEAELHDTEGIRLQLLTYAVLPDHVRLPV